MEQKPITGQFKSSSPNLRPKTASEIRDDMFPLTAKLDTEFRRANLGMFYGMGADKMAKMLDPYRGIRRFLYVA